MKTLLRFVCLLSLMAGSTYAIAQNAGATNAPKILFINNDSAYDFGGVPMDMGVTYEFEIKNTGSAPLTISAMNCESKNTASKWPTKAIKPGKKGYLSITYTAHRDIGDFEHDVYVISNTSPDTTIIHISGTVIPAESPYNAPPKPKGNIQVEAKASPSPLVKPNE